MRPAAARTYRIRDFAALAGVTARALRHYERVGMLNPRRTSAGHRVYRAEDLALLEQVVALKFIGFPLKAIRSLLQRDRSELPRALRAQRAILEEKKALLDRAIKAIGEAEAVVLAGGDLDNAAFRHIIEVIEMQDHTDEWKTRYDALVQAKIERLKSMSPDMKAGLQKQWTDLLNDVRAALDEDPGGPRGQELAARWVTLLGAFAPAGTPDSELVKMFGAAYQPADFSRRASGPFADKRVWEFIGRALARR